VDAGRAKAVVRAYFQRLLVDKDVSTCDELLAPEFIDHDAPAGTPPGPAATKRFVGAFLARHPDLRFDIEEMLGEGSRVALRARWVATDAETGAPYRQRGIVIVRVNEAGQLTERWSAYTDLA
jgi:ketosteroid isomerase-like protein